VDIPYCRRALHKNLPSHGWLGNICFGHPCRIRCGSVVICPGFVVVQCPVMWTSREGEFHAPGAPPRQGDRPDALHRNSRPPGPVGAPQATATPPDGGMMLHRDWPRRMSCCPETPASFTSLAPWQIQRTGVILPPRPTKVPRASTTTMTPTERDRHLISDQARGIGRLAPSGSPAIPFDRPPIRPRRGLRRSSQPRNPMPALAPCPYRSNNRWGLDWFMPALLRAPPRCGTVACVPRMIPRLVSRRYQDYWY
jgi:hypothetical protein